MYSQDYDGLLPPATTKLPGGHFGTPWQGQLDVVWWDLVLPYLRNERVLYCPLAPPYLPSYWVNAKLTFVTPGALDVCENPSQTILLFEGFVPDRAPEAVYIPACAGIRPEYDEVFRHTGKMNVCFADGHVKTTLPDDMRGSSPLWGPGS